MRKLSTAVILLFTLCLNVRAQSILLADSTHQFLSDLKKTKTDSVRLNILVKLGGYYLYKPGEIKSDLDSADLFLDQAKELSSKLKIFKIQNKVCFLKADVLFERGDLPKARIGYLGAIDNYTRSGEMKEAAHAWLSIAVRTMYSKDSTEIRGLHGFEHALNIYTELGDKEKEAEVRKYIGDWLLQQGKLDQSENELLKALSLYQSVGYKKLHYTYDLLAAISNKRGDFNKSLYYSLEMIKSIQATGDTVVAFGLYLKMANIYNNLNEYDKSKYWYNRALINGAKDPRLFYTINNSLIAVMLKEGKKKEALDFLLTLIKKRPPPYPDDKVPLVARLGEIYSLLGKDELAEKYYRQAIFFAKKTLWKYTELAADKQMADFYFSRKRYDLAGIYLHKALAGPGGISDIELIRSTYLELFKTDSATGNYFSAIKNYQRYKSLTDSIFTVAKAKQITQLQLQFEKDQKVQKLEDKGKLQQAELQHAGTVKNVTIGGIVLLLVIAGLLYRQNRLRKKSNELLERLLTEKEWLLKEVHHRVKNNLHTVICLLESQAAYLENDALKAIEISQHRIYAMSLIHQKLYQSEDIKMIDMDLYINEFVQYLADSFGPPANIVIRRVIEPLKLGVSQAIPLGLILNEAVTNSFKYAFPDNKAGEIFIGLKQAGNVMELVIADNGIGIQRHADENEPHSLGIELMKGLTRDIKGNITFDIGIGTKITVIFAVDSLDNNPTTGISPKRSFLAYEN
jgi:two-component system, sensor histidine kinase PdtaS